MTSKLLLVLIPKKKFSNDVSKFCSSLKKFKQRNHCYIFEKFYKCND